MTRDPQQPPATHAVCSEVLEHVDDPVALMRNSTALLAPGAKVVVTVPGGPRSAFDKHIGHFRHFTAPALHQVLTDAGLDVDRVLRTGFPFFNLYKLAVVARGQKLVDDMEHRPPGTEASRLEKAVTGFFTRTFPLNRDDARLGWQLAAVAHVPLVALSVLITRTPLRITLGGGGTDLPSYYQEHGGMVVSAAITQHIYISINRTFTDDYFLKYSQLERVDKPDQIEHPIVREVLRAHDVGPSVEIVSTADIPSGTGLGSSGSFTVGLLKAVHAMQRNHVSASDLGREACEIEIERLGRTVGKQDQYIAAFGGITRFDFNPDGSVDVAPARLSSDTVHDLEQHLLMFFTGYSRAADQVLAEQVTKSQSGDQAMIDNLHFVKDLGLRQLDALESDDVTGFADLMHEHWLNKKKRSSAMSNPRIDELYDLGRNAGARGGKLVGAGAGGFLMFYAEDTRRVRAAMREEGLTELRFGIDLAGSTMLVRE